MTDWPRVAAILEQGLELAAEERARFFEEAAAGDAALLEELRALAASHDRADASAFIEQPLAAAEPGLVLQMLQPGQRIGAYEILEEAGRGGMGVVYRARDTRLGRDVAVKCVAEAANARERARLEHEARMAARLSHPAIATVYALEEREPHGVGDPELYLISEFVRGGTLRDRLARERISEPELSRLALAIADGLAAAHRGGVAHGDLKPENIVISDAGQIKILDFGLAETRDAIPVVGAAAAGTPGYMAPEQLRGRTADARADVFAFGVLLFEMATGRHPFAGDRGAMLEAALSRRAAFEAPDLPPALAPIVAKCLSPDPAMRFPSAVELVEALGAPAAPRPPGRSLWWFQVHQRTVAAFAAAAPIVAWLVRPELGRPWGSILFLLTFAGATAVLMLRLNADFIARERPSELRRHLANTRTRTVSVELALDAVLLLAAPALAGTVDWAAALFSGCAIASILALTVIEPATTRAALKKGE